MPSARETHERTVRIAKAVMMATPNRRGLPRDFIFCISAFLRYVRGSPELATRTCAHHQNHGPDVVRTIVYASSAFDHMPEGAGKPAGGELNFFHLAWPSL